MSYFYSEFQYLSSSMYVDNKQKDANHVKISAMIGQAYGSPP